MAKPIKETPVLSCKDAFEFSIQMEKSNKTRISEQERAKIRKNFDELSAIAKF